MQWHTLGTMIFAIGAVYGGLIIFLTVAFFKHQSIEEDEN